VTRRGKGPDIAAFDLLDAEEPFEIDDQNAHLFKHPLLGLDDALDVWSSDAEFYEDDSDGPADRLMVGEIPGGDVLVIPLAPSNHSGFAKMRPIGVFRASQYTVDRYRADREGWRR
jgi:hypothetical protein